MKHAASITTPRGGPAPERWPRYDTSRSYDWNYEHVPDPIDCPVPDWPETASFAGLPVASPLGVAAGPLLNGRWCLYYASLGFDVLTYKTVRSRARPCYPWPNLVPVDVRTMRGGEACVPAAPDMRGSWAVSFGMPSRDPSVWREDVEKTRDRLAKGKLLSVSVVGTVEAGEGLDALAGDYAQCAAWAVESGADVVEANFSCPNVDTRDGQLYQQPDAAECVAQALRQAVGRVPLVVKIGHLMDDGAVDELLRRLAGTVDGLAMTNSVASPVAGVGEQGRLFDGQPRGICGRAILEASVAQVRRFSERKTAEMQLIGVGGALTLGDLDAYHRAGASAVHLATGVMVDPACGLAIRAAKVATKS